MFSRKVYFELLGVSHEIPIGWAVFTINPAKFPRAEKGEGVLKTSCLLILLELKLAFPNGWAQL